MMLRPMSGVVKRHSLHGGLSVFYTRASPIATTYRAARIRACVKWLALNKMLTASMSIS